MKTFKGKTVFITGGASGIGLALAEECCEEGMNVVIADIRRNAIDNAMTVLGQRKSVLAIELDVTNREAYEKAVEEAEAKFGNIHILFNNAGIGCARGALWDASYEQIDLALNINLSAVLTGIHLVVPRMLKHGEGGYVVNTASKAALIAVPACGLYNLTKQALISLSETLASDLSGTDVGAAVFLPGPYLSNLGQTSGEIEQMFLGTLPPGVPPRASGERNRAADFVRPASDAAKRILQGIKRGDLYIITHSEFKEGFEKRTNAMLQAFPDERPNEEFKELFDILVTNPVFDKQTQVPALVN